MSLDIAKWFDEDLRTVASSGLSAAVGQVTETDLAQPIAWAPKNRLIGQASETDSAQALTRVKTKALGQATETDTAQALTRVKAKALGQASETDSAQALTHAKSKVIAQATETDTAQAVARVKAKALGQVVETDAAQAVGRLKAKALGQVSETDLAQAITRASAGLSGAVGQVSESDVAQAINWAPKIRLLGMAIEIDAAGAITVVQAGASAQPNDYRGRGGRKPLPAPDYETVAKAWDTADAVSEWLREQGRIAEPQADPAPARTGVPVEAKARPGHAPFDIAAAIKRQREAAGKVKSPASAMAETRRVERLAQDELEQQMLMAAVAVVLSEDDF